MNLLKTFQKSFLLSVFFLPAIAFSQNLAVIGNEVVPAKEFIWVFKKHHANRSRANYEELAAYLQKYIDLRLKVLDALALKMDRDSAYQKEIQDFEKLIRARLRGKQELEYVLNEYRNGVLMFNVSELTIWAPAYGDQATTIEQTEQREKDWIRNLRKRYPVTINEEELRKLSLSKL